jgi:hypothetical protein
MALGDVLGPVLGIAEQHVRLLTGEQGVLNAGCPGQDSGGLLWPVPEVTESVDDLPGFGTGAVVGVNVDPPDGAAGIEDDVAVSAG